MIITERRGNELYVYCNGSLMYKRWINQNYGMVFCPVQGNYVPAKNVKNDKSK